MTIFHPTDRILSFIYFYIYSYLRAALVKRSNKASSGGSKTTASAMLLITEELMIGFLSGVVSKGITTPLSVITVQLQSEEEQDNTGALHQEKHGQSEDVPTSRTSLARVVRRVYSDGGLSGFFKGMALIGTGICKLDARAQECLLRSSSAQTLRSLCSSFKPFVGYSCVVRTVNNLQVHKASWEAPSPIVWVSICVFCRIIRR